MKLSGDKKARVKQHLFDIQQGLCRYCGRRMNLNGPEKSKLLATIDHIVPLRRGGTWAKPNLILACSRCNNYKGCVIIPQWLWEDTQTLRDMFLNRKLNILETK